jgi:hypothetical protein
MRRIVCGVLLWMFAASHLQAQSMGQVLEADHPAALRTLPLVNALLAGNMAEAISQGRHNAAPAYADGGMEGGLRSLGAAMQASGPYAMGSVLLAASVGVIIELRQTAGGTSSALLITTEPEPSYRITGIRQVQMSIGGGTPPAAGAPGSPVSGGGRQVPTLAYSGDGFEIHAPPGMAVDGARRDLDFAVETWRRHFGEAPPRLAVVMFESTSEVSAYDFAPLRSGGMLTLPWTEGLVNLSGRRALPHEACHMFFVGYARARETGGDRPAGAPRSYGVPDIADWFDEAVATLCEYPDMQADRIAHLQAQWNERIPLEELLAMEHPTMPLVRGSGASHTEGGMTLTHLTMQGGEHAALLQRSALFYSQVLAFAQFLIERHGALHIRELAERLTAAADPTHRLYSSAEVTLLEQEWSSWLQALAAPLR